MLSPSSPPFLWAFYSLLKWLCVSSGLLYFSRRIFILICVLLFLGLTTGSPWDVHCSHCWPLVPVAWFSIEEAWLTGSGGDTAVWVSVGKLSAAAKVSSESHFPTKLQGSWPASKAERIWAHLSNGVQTHPKRRRLAGAPKIIPQAGTLSLGVHKSPQGSTLSRKPLHFIIIDT